MFTDDIVLISDSDVRSLQIKIVRVDAELETWFNRNDVVINAGKNRSTVNVNKNPTDATLCRY